MLQEEVRKQFHDAMARVPWILRFTTGEITNANEISTDEAIHGLALLVIEQARINERLAGEIDKLNAVEGH
jgi:hypothetical protein